MITPEKLRWLAERADATGLKVALDPFTAEELMAIANGLESAAGPWIRVDSGERPEHMGEVLLMMPTLPRGLALPGIVLHGKYYGANDSFAYGPKLTPASNFTHWARINPPEEP